MNHIFLKVESKPPAAEIRNYEQITEWGKGNSEIQIPLDYKGFKAHIGIPWQQWIEKEFKRLRKLGRKPVIYKRQFSGIQYYALFAIRKIQSY